MTSNKWIAVSLIAAQLGILNGQAFAGEARAKNREPLRPSYDTYSSDIKSVEAQKNGSSAGYGALIGFAAGWVPGLVARNSYNYHVGKWWNNGKVFLGTWAATIAAGAATGHLIASGKDEEKQFVDRIKKSPEYHTLIVRLGKPKAEQFVADLVTLYQEGMSDEAMTEFLKKYPEIETEAGQMMATSETSVNVSARKLLSTGNPIAIAAKDATESESDASVTSKAVE